VFEVLLPKIGFWSIQLSPCVHCGSLSLDNTNILYIMEWMDSHFVHYIISTFGVKVAPTHY
jgi:hypothetical protein